MCSSDLPDISEMTIAVTGFLRGFSVGFVFVALSTVTFTTLPPELRTEGTSIFSLLRNLGSSIGISVTAALLISNTQANHASIAALVTPFNRALYHGAVAKFWNPLTAQGVTALNNEVTRQAATIAYIDDFKLMMVLSLIALPLVLLLRKPRTPAGSGGHAVME